VLDTNHVIPLLRDGHEHRPAIQRRLERIPADSPIYVATVTVAELEVGCCLGTAARSDAQEEIRRVIRKNGLTPLEFTVHTAAEYGVLKASLMQKYGRGGLKQAAKWPEMWTSPLKGHPLGVDELDLIMVSHGIERNLVLVTTDPMNRIFDGVLGLRTSLRIQNWTDLSGSPT